jgi:hypothetical protein
MPPNDWQQRELLPLPDNLAASKRVLGDRLKSLTPLNRDALGRGHKGKAHGSISHKTITRTRKSGKVKTYQQAWYQWQNATGKHCLYLNHKQAAEVRIMLDEGAIVAEILDAISPKRL